MTENEPRRAVFRDRLKSHRRPPPNRPVVLAASIRYRPALMAHRKCNSTHRHMQNVTQTNKNLKIKIKQKIQKKNLFQSQRTFDYNFNNITKQQQK